MQPGVLAHVHRAYAGYEIYQIENNMARIDRAPGVTLYAAGNAVNNTDEAQLHAGIQKMNRAFLDRFGVTIITDYPTPDQEVEVIQGIVKSKYPSQYNVMMRNGLKQKIAKIIQAANTMRKLIKDGSLPIALSVRRTTAWTLLFCYYDDMTIAVKHCLLNIEDTTDAVTIDSIVKQVFGNDYTCAYAVNNVTPPTPAP